MTAEQTEDNWGRGECLPFLPAGSDRVDVMNGVFVFLRPPPGAWTPTSSTHRSSSLLAQHGTRTLADIAQSLYAEEQTGEYIDKQRSALV